MSVSDRQRTISYDATRKRRHKIFNNRCSRNRESLNFSEIIKEKQGTIKVAPQQSPIKNLVMLSTSPISLSNQ